MEKKAQSAYGRGNVTYRTSRWVQDMPAPDDPCRMTAMRLLNNCFDLMSRISGQTRGDVSNDCRAIQQTLPVLRNATPRSTMRIMSHPWVKHIGMPTAQAPGVPQRAKRAPTTKTRMNIMLASSTRRAAKATTCAIAGNALMCADSTRAQDRKLRDHPTAQLWQDTRKSQLCRCGLCPDVSS